MQVIGDRFITHFEVQPEGEGGIWVHAGNNALKPEQAVIIPEVTQW